MQSRLTVLTFTLLAALGLLSGCTAPPVGALPRPDLSARKARVVVTTSMIEDAAKRVGGPLVEVTALMKAGVDPHLYRATASDFEQLNKADLILYNGLHLEGKMTDTFEEMRNRVRTVAVTDTLDPNADLRPAENGYDGTHDPHVWFDVTLWMKVVDRVAEALADLDPAHAAEYRENASKYRKQLADLHEEVKETVKVLPRERRVVITAHDAFYYFGRAYGFEVRGLQGISTGAEPSTKDVDDLARFIVERRIPAIFGETSVPRRSIEAVQQAARNKGFEVKYLDEGLYSDSLGDADGPAGTYIGMVRHNVKTIVDALK